MLRAYRDDRPDPLRNPIPKGENVLTHDLYEIYASEKQWTQADVDPLRTRELRLNYAEHLRTYAEPRMLDIGCGQGDFLDFARLQGWRCTGVDISEDLVKLCRSKGHEAYHADAIAYLASTAERYDVIILNDVVEHFEKKAAAGLLEAVRSSLAPGGAVLVRVPNANHPFSSFYRYTDFTHEMLYEEASLRYLLRMAGFSEISVHDYRSLVRNPARRMVRSAMLSVYGLAFLIFVGRKRPVDMNIFAIGKV